jgi:iron complex transport system substrate-binding protein
MRKDKLKLCCVYVACVILAMSCQNGTTEKKDVSLQRIVSLNGTISEIVCELGLISNLVGVDITSNYPSELTKLPKAGHNRNINIEAVIAMQPTVILALKENLKQEHIDQFASAKIPVYTFTLEYSVEGAKRLIKTVADTLGVGQKSDAIVAKIDSSIRKIPKYDTKPKVLFIYARGVGNMSVGGKKTAIDEMISLAGGENAASDFQDFKPFSTESLVQKNPDVLLLFDSGLESLKGDVGLLQIPAVMLTNAGKNKRIETMDGQLLSGFSPRVGDAVLELSEKIHRK